MADKYDTECLAERQENELKVLQSIYPEDVIDLREGDAWKVQRPPDVQIHLQPQDSMQAHQAHVSLDMIITCPRLYPEKPPDIKLEKVKGISNKVVANLKRELTEKATELIGGEMMLELCQHVQESLHAHNKPLLSFYDQMVSNDQKRKEKLAREEQRKIDLLKKKEERQLQDIEDEIERREAMKEQAKKRRQQAKELERHSVSDPTTPVNDGMNLTPILMDTEQRQRMRAIPQLECQTPVSTQHSKPERKSTVAVNFEGRTSTPMAGQRIGDHLNQPCQDHLGTTVLEFKSRKDRKIFRGKCLGHSPRGSTVYVGMDTDTGELVAISEWVLKWRNPNRKLDLDDKELDDKEAAKYKKLVGSIESEFPSLQRLYHQNLVHYLAFNYHLDNGQISIYVLFDFVGGGSLCQHLKHNEPIQTEILRNYTIQILEALFYLHNKAVVHKDLRASSILLDTSGKVRLGDYSLIKRLSELVRTVEISRGGVHFEVEKSPPTIGRGGKKGDIYRLGILLLSLAQGENIVDTIPQIPTSLPQDFQDFLTKCLLHDERHRWTANQLLEHSFVKTPLYAIYHTPKKLEEPHHQKQEILEDKDDEKLDTDIPYIPASDSGSRLQNEFEILKYIGKGGFGDVIKVKNKLDGRFYAIKRIPLNPKSKQFTRKITREVKLLSRLNHENVVRYYNSWIETSQEPVPADSSSTITLDSRGGKISSSSTSSHIGKAPSAHVNSLGLNDELEKMAPSIRDNSVEWSIATALTCSRNEDSSSSDDDDDDDDDDVFGASFMNFTDSDDGIVFDSNSQYADWSDNQDNKNNGKQYQKESEKEENHSETTAVPKLQFLYIQMEFCDKSTLRDCIDEGLYEDMDRVWRFFREMIEGLQHIHEQGMIHRDLKPVNIFLETFDHVKIGDFGLATTDILSKQQSSLIDFTLNPTAMGDMRTSFSRSESLGDGGLTGKVGTALYVSPEVMDTSSRAQYNQKVDMYSLGIIFFEMCYPPLPTGMERVKVLTNLRQVSTDFPDNFDEVDLQNQAYIIKWLLNHDPNKRPTCRELLQSDNLPPPQLEEAELNEVLRSTISNPQSKSYRHMLDALFSQTVPQALDFAYDNDLYKSSASVKQILAQMSVASLTERIFKKHGAIKFSTPTLMPKSGLFEKSESYVCTMDHSGGLVALTYDLRAPFARYLARHGVNNIKRYSIEKVYRENRIYGSHPRELMACAFDVVTSASLDSLVPDAEVIHVVFEIINEIPSLQSRNYYLRLNHTSILRAVLLHSNVPEDLHQEVYAILGDTKAERQKKLQVQTRLCSLSLSDNTISSLYRFCEMELTFEKISNELRCLTRAKGETGRLAKKGLHEIEVIISHLNALGLKAQPVLAIGLMNTFQHYGGTFFQIVTNVRRKNKQTLDVLAAGGRYDCMIEYFRKPNMPATQSAVGVSISFEKLVSAFQEQPSSGWSGAVDVLVCSLGHKLMINEKLNVAKDLWAAGLSADILHDNSQSLEEIQDYCRENGITHIVILKDTDSNVKVRSLEDKMVEKKMPLSDVGDYLQYKVQLTKSDNPEPSQVTPAKTPALSSQLSGESSSGITTNSLRPTPAITFMPDGKLSKNQKRTYESQIYSNSGVVLGNFSSKSWVEIIAVELNIQVLKTIAAYVEFSGEGEFEKSIGIVMEKHQRFRKYLTKIFDEIYDLRFNKKCPVIMLYDLKDNSCKVLM